MTLSFYTSQKIKNRSGSLQYSTPGPQKSGMKSARAGVFAAAGLVLASAISDQEHVKAFSDVASDPRWTNETRGRRNQDKAIYGPDSRQDEADTTDFWRSIGRSTVIITSARHTGSVWGSCGTLGARCKFKVPPAQNPPAFAPSMHFI